MSSNGSRQDGPITRYEKTLPHRKRHFYANKAKCQENRSPDTSFPSFCMDQTFLFCAEAVLAYAAERAYPVFRYVSPCCARSYSVVRIADCRVIYITACVTYILFHVIPPVSSVRIPDTISAAYKAILQSRSPKFHTISKEIKENIAIQTRPADCRRVSPQPLRSFRFRLIREILLCVRFPLLLSLT